MKGFIKVALIFVVCWLIVNICRANFYDMQEHETYVSSTDSEVKIELTKKDEELTDVYGNVIFTNHVAYLHVDEETYEGTYKLFVSNKFQKELWVDFYGYNKSDSNPNGALHEYFKVKRNKLTVMDGYLHDDIFIENKTFTRRTWWSTWGKKVFGILVIIFILWLFKDVPELLRTGELKKMIKEEFEII